MNSAETNIRATNLLQPVHQVTIELRFGKSLCPFWICNHLAEEERCVALFVLSSCCHVTGIVTALAIHFIHLFSLRSFACNRLIHIVNMLLRVRKRLNPNRMCVSFADHFAHK